MLKNIVARKPVTEVRYEIEYLYNDESGFGFPCDAEGNPGEMPKEAAENLAWCRANPDAFEVAGKVRKLVHRYTEPAHGTCICGREVTLWDEYYGACQCECRRWYNLFGQELLAPEYWEDDPGEEL